MPRSSKWSLSTRFPYQNLVCNSPDPHATYPIDLSFLDFITWIIFGEKWWPCCNNIVKNVLKSTF
jgi:hypothetical protein